MRISTQSTASTLGPPGSPERSIHFLLGSILGRPSRPPAGAFEQNELTCARSACLPRILLVTDLEEVAMRALALTILTMGIALASGQAGAQTYDPAFPVCMHVIPWGGGAYYDCSYYTMAQCAASASGRAAQCDPNPYYAGSTASSPRNGRRYRQVGSISTTRAETLPDSYCLQGRIWGYPGNCQFSSYAQCMATASGTDAYCGINPQYAFARQRQGAYRHRY